MDTVAGSVRLLADDDVGHYGHDAKVGHRLCQEALVAMQVAIRPSSRS